MVKLSDELIADEISIEGGKTIRRRRYIGEHLISDRVKELENKLIKSETEVDKLEKEIELIKEQFMNMRR